VAKRTIFVPHCSELLTDHLPHGDGLIAHGFISHLARRGHRLHVAVQGASLREPLPANVTLHRISLSFSGPIWGRLEYMVRVRELLNLLKRDVPFDLIHQMNPVFAGVSLALIGSGVPLVLGTYVASWPHTLNAKSSKGWVRRSLARCRDSIARLQQQRADALLLTTPAASNRLPKPAAVRERVHLLPHGIDTELFSPGPSVQEKTEPTPGPILFLANVVEYKGIFTLIEAFPAVAREVPGIRLQIAGDGNRLDEARRRASRLPCASQVEFLGRQERADTPALYRNCGVYCLPSFGEPYGGTLVEAMSCGKAVVVTEAGGPPHIVLREGAFFVPVGDAEALSKALIEALRDPVRLKAMGRHNRRVVEKSMSWERVTDRLENIYESVLSGGAAMGRANSLTTAGEPG